MSSGYVLDFTDAKFAKFFQEMGIDICNPKYTVNQTSKSKAKRLRGFWEQEDDIKVGVVIEKIIDYAEYLLEGKSENSLTNKEKKLVADCRNIVTRLIGKSTKTNAPLSENAFLAINFGKINFSKLPIEGQLHSILKNRLNEAQQCLENGANLSAIFMAGSVLEGVLLGAAQKYPKQFNKSPACPNDETGKPKPFQEWTLSQLINVGREVNILGEDVKKFSHNLRDFRNYIHPYQQMYSNFTPDADTARICLQVLKAALSDLIKNKPGG